MGTCPLMQVLLPSSETLWVLHRYAECNDQVRKMARGVRDLILSEALQRPEVSRSSCRMVFFAKHASGSGFLAEIASPAVGALETTDE